MSDSKSNDGLGFFGALFLVFLALKLTGYVTWSWWWIAAPLWAPFIVLVLVISLIAMSRQ
jgi:hypothetical protein